MLISSIAATYLFKDFDTNDYSIEQAKEILTER